MEVDSLTAQSPIRPYTLAGVSRELERLKKMFSGWRMYSWTGRLATRITAASSGNRMKAEGG